MSEIEKYRKAPILKVALTGHRSSKLWGYDLNSAEYNKLRDIIGKYKS